MFNEVSSKPRKTDIESKKGLRLAIALVHLICAIAALNGSGLHMNRICTIMAMINY